MKKDCIPHYITRNMGNWGNWGIEWAFLRDIFPDRLGIIENIGTSGKGGSEDVLHMWEIKKQNSSFTGLPIREDDPL